MSIANEMLQDPAILMTSKNPSISSTMPLSSLDLEPSTSYSPIQTIYGKTILAAALPESGGAIPKNSKRNAQAGKSPKSKKNRNRRKNTVSNVENLTPTSSTSRNSTRSRPRQFKTSNSVTGSGGGGGSVNMQSKSNPSGSPLSVNQVMPKQSSPTSSFKRNYSNTRFNHYEKNRFSPQMNYGRGFIPPILVKPGLFNEYVSQEIMDYHQRNRQSNESYKSKQILRQGLENTLKQAFPNHFVNLYIVGSSTNGIGDNVNTVDICVISRNRQSESSVKSTSECEMVKHAAQALTSDESNSIEIIEAESLQSETDSVKETTEVDEKECDEQPESEEIEKKVIAAADSIADKDTDNNMTLDKIENVLRGKNFAQNIKVIPAKVPIIKFKDSICKLDVTLNLNQDVSIRNSQLIRDYAKMDWRFPHLAMIMKEWARENRINSAVAKGISSYSWTLMVIHFLQVCEPPVLPCLQKMIPRRYDSRTPIEQAMNIWRRPPTKWQSNNTSNLRQLIKALFRYYGYVFSYDQHVISVREGKVLDRTQFLRPNSTSEDMNFAWNSYLCIEEPFNRTNTSRSVHDKEVFDRIIDLFRTSSNALKGNRISLFNIIVDDLEFPINY